MPSVIIAYHLPHVQAFTPQPDVKRILILITALFKFCGFIAGFSTLTGYMLRRKHMLYIAHIVRS